MENYLITGENLIFLKTCGDGEVFKTLQDNLQYFVDVSKDLHKYGAENKTMRTWTNPTIRAKIVEQWLRDNDGTEGIKTFGLWRVIQRHKLTPDQIFPLFALYVVQCEINDCKLETNKK